MQKEKFVFSFHFRVIVISAKPKLRKVEGKTKELTLFLLRRGIIVNYFCIFASENDRGSTDY